MQFKQRFDLESAWSAINISKILIMKKLENFFFGKIGTNGNPKDTKGHSIQCRPVSGDRIKPTYYIIPFYATYYFCQLHVLGSFKMQQYYLADFISYTV